MPRLARIDAAGILHHVIVRGIEKKPVFASSDDKKDFVERLSCLVAETRHAIYAWAILTNHVHLLVRTGDVPLSKFMARLLTGYASSYNKRHRRVGHLFQNRYKSIICEEEPYFKELVRYIHLNPLRTGLVSGYDGLCVYPWSGHCAIIGARHYSWQDTAFILSFFDSDVKKSVRAYQDFVLSGVDLGRRPELTGGGLIRSLGGWEQAKTMKTIHTVKGDERILGGTTFVINVLERAQQAMTKRYEAQISGINIGCIEKKICALYGIAEDDLRTRYQRRVVEAKCIICFLAVELLAISSKELALRYRINEPAVSYLLKKGREMSRAENLMDIFNF